MLIGERLRTIRESKNLTQGDIKRRAGLLPAYVSRVENGHSVPALETLEKFARALEVPLYVLFYEGEEPVPIHAKAIPRRGRPARDAAFERRMVRLLAGMDERSRGILLDTSCSSGVVAAVCLIHSGSFSAPLR